MPQAGFQGRLRTNRDGICVQEPGAVPVKAVNTILPMKKSYSRLVIVAALPVIVLLGGCIAIGTHQPAQVHATLGQQLIDLQKARDQGAISQREYEIERARLMNLPPPVAMVR
jgi:hypothetical protein